MTCNSHPVGWSTSRASPSPCRSTKPSADHERQACLRRQGADLWRDRQALTVTGRSGDPSSDHVLGDPVLTQQSRLGSSTTKCTDAPIGPIVPVCVELTALPGRDWLNASEGSVCA